MSYTSIRVTYVILCNYMLYSYIIIYYNKIVISVSNMFNENTIVQGFDFVARVLEALRQGQEMWRLKGDGKICHTKVTLKMQWKPFEVRIKHVSNISNLALVSCFSGDQILEKSENWSHPGMGNHRSFVDTHQESDREWIWVKDVKLCRIYTSICGIPLPSL